MHKLCSTSSCTSAATVSVNGRDLCGVCAMRIQQPPVGGTLVIKSYLDDELRK